MGFFGILGILFIGLKLASVIHWSWWLVLLPLYGPLLLAGSLACVCFMLAGFAQFCEEQARKRK